MVNIGIDFDGVIADSNDLKIQLAKEKFGIEIKPEDTSKGKILKLGLDLDSYNNTFRKIISSEQRYKIRLAPHAKKVIEQFRMEHSVYIITSRHSHEIPYVRDWLKHKNVEYDLLLNTSDKSKNPACLENKIRIYLDDELHKLEQITNRYTQLFLLDRPHNRSVEIKDPCIKRVSDWKDFYKEAKYLL